MKNCIRCQFIIFHKMWRVVRWNLIFWKMNCSPFLVPIIKYVRTIASQFGLFLSLGIGLWPSKRSPTLGNQYFILVGVSFIVTFFCWKTRFITQLILGLSWKTQTGISKHFVPAGTFFKQISKTDFCLCAPFPPIVAPPADEWLRERLPKKFLEPKYWFPSHFCPLLVDIARALRMPQRQFSFTSSTLFNDSC